MKTAIALFALVLAGCVHQTAEQRAANDRCARVCSRWASVAHAPEPVSMAGDDHCTCWSPQLFRGEMRRPTDAVFVLTDSRWVQEIVGK